MSQTADQRDGRRKAIDAERRRRQRMRNWAVLLALVGFCAVVYAITIVRLKGG
ncbi:MAG: hypothetical protein ABWY00_00440 [Dongiaceae bacterium]